MLHTDRIVSKIKTAQEVRALVGPRPRTDKVILCHGVFDIVHPGHIRHLHYAKSKAPILVASVTADVHITRKGSYRPFVLEHLRAINLAALEVVDWVVIDDHPTATEILSIIEPDYYAKGYEYVARGLPEIQVVQAYGGEVLFTPGDVVYSSTQLLKIAEPDLRYEKLKLCMEHNNVTFEDLRDTLDRMQGKRVHVVGDLIVDSITQCSLIGSQAKTPTISAWFERREDFVGGAGVVAKHCAAAGAKVSLLTAYGVDDMGHFADRDLRAHGIKIRCISRQTNHKNVIVVDGYRLLKVDRIDNAPINPLDKDVFSSTFESPVDAVIFADFRHGIFHHNSIPQLIGAIPKEAFRAADSQVASRWGNITDFKGFDLITPNEREARFALGDQDSGIRQLASELRAKAEAVCVILKLGQRGALYETVSNSFTLDSFADNVVDPVGAGDALLAYATLAMMVNLNETQATILGMIAAACACETNGNVAVEALEVRNRLTRIEECVAWT